MLMLTGLAVRERGLALAGRIATATGARIFAQGSTPASSAAPGRVPIERLPYPVDQALGSAEGRAPSHPGRRQGPGGVLRLSGQAERAHAGRLPGAPALRRWPRIRSARWRRWPTPWGPRRTARWSSSPGRPALPTGALTPETLAAALGALLPEGAIVSDESVTTGRGFFKATAGAPPHDWMNNMGGSIGLGLPVATGAAVACPDRKVVCLEADGSGMYTMQALWTQAREGLDVTTVIFANRTYAILRDELSGVRAGTPGPKAADMLDIGRPDLDWVSLARGMGVPASRATTAEEFNKQFAPARRPRALPDRGRALAAAAAISVRRRARHVERRVAVEEADGLEHEADRGHRHHRPVLGAGDVVRAEGVPDARRRCSRAARRPARRSAGPSPPGCWFG